MTIFQTLLLIVIFLGISIFFFLKRSEHIKFKDSTYLIVMAYCRHYDNDVYFKTIKYEASSIQDARNKAKLTGYEHVSSSSLRVNYSYKIFKYIDNDIIEV